MNAITEAQKPVSSEVLEQVLGTGDLSRLSPRQKVEYMTKACELIGLNPLTRPFRFLTFQGQTTMYATRDCADQLRKLHKISLTIADKSIDNEIYTVTARAKMPDGREDEDFGSVHFAKTLHGEARANATMKAITKAKRRVTLSICGLGFLDETEVETLVPQGAQTFDADEPPPAPRMIMAKELPLHTQTAPAPGQTARRPTWSDWLNDLEAELGGCEATEEIDAIVAREETQKATKLLRNGAADRLNQMIRDAYDRISAANAPSLDSEIPL